MIDTLDKSLRRGRQFACDVSKRLVVWFERFVFGLTELEAPAVEQLPFANGPITVIVSREGVVSPSVVVTRLWRRTARGLS